MAETKSPVKAAVGKEKLSFEAQCVALKLPDWQVAAVKAKYDYPVGFMLTAQELSKAVEETLNEAIL